MPTLYLNGFETDARLKNDCVEISRVDHERDDVRTMSVPFFDIERVVVVGRADVTTPLLQRLAREGIPVHFMTGHGRWLGALYPNKNGHALRRLRQYDLARDGVFALSVACRAVEAKVRNCRRVLQRLAANRHMAHEREQTEVCDSLQSLVERTGRARAVGTLRGLEGMAAALYFKRLHAFFPEDLPFNGRNRRPPKDAANALLSWTYTIALSEVDAAVRAAGFDPCLGFLHEISYGRPSLSLDLLEPLRAPLCDMLALRLLNHRILNPDHFEYHSDDGGTYLSKEARKQFFVAYERTMCRRFAPAKGAAHTDFRGVIREQVNAMLRAMEGRAGPAFFLMP